MNAPLIEAERLTKHFFVGGQLSGGRKRVVAVEEVDVSLRPGEALGLVGESGCGKSSVGRLLLRLLEPTSGTVRLLGRDVAKLSGPELRRLRTRMQIVFQDPFSSLNPRHRVSDILGAPFSHPFQRAARRNRRQGSRPHEAGRTRPGNQPEISA